ncbi:uncharacterized protein LOC119641088 isoform X2 [Glossina fuscipes]|uniref:Uncharacterized protein LOC119641088 isoform X2 n=1 Tax=Glossina fuscipes TaxID=7396 RepID=A0A9C5ZJ62_9MUSC|nr:uncharacterized protein LOC119641088 isoform X2 [Glossina fuscipes]
MSLRRGCVYGRNEVTGVFTNKKCLAFKAILYAEFQDIWQHSLKYIAGFLFISRNKKEVGKFFFFFFLNSYIFSFQVYERLCGGVPARPSTKRPKRGSKKKKKEQKEETRSAAPIAEYRSTT